MEQAIKRMHDTLRSPAESEHLPEFDHRLEKTVNIDYKACGMAWNTPRAPMEMNGYPYNRPSSRETVDRRKP